MMALASIYNTPPVPHKLASTLVTLNDDDDDFNANAPPRVTSTLLSTLLLLRFKEAFDVVNFTGEYAVGLVVAVVAVVNPVATQSPTMMQSANNTICTILNPVFRVGPVLRYLRLTLALSIIPLLLRLELV